MNAMNRSRRAQAGLSLVELLVAVTLGLMLMAGLAALFANTSASRTELERNARQIENGRFAMEVLSDDLRLAGFYGEQPIAASALPTNTDVCSINPAEWQAQMPISVQHFDKGVGVPTCITGLAPIKADTDVVVIRRVSTCEAGVDDCPVALPGQPYLQVAKCATETAVALPALPYVFDKMGGPPFNLHDRDCGTIAKMRRYMLRVYFISTDNGNGVALPTLMRAEFNGATFDLQPMVEGIEELNIEYGIDFQGQAYTAGPDGQPDAYTADPSTHTNPVCAAAGNCPASTLASITAARITLLARNLEASANYADTKTYNLGRDAGGLDVLVTPGGPYRRHAYTGMVRIVNVAERRERPL
jgi:type IV pilus assembly protein PilW